MPTHIEDNHIMSLNLYSPKSTALGLAWGLALTAAPSAPTSRNRLPHGQCLHG
jgi:hypothetical protein